MYKAALRERLYANRFMEADRTKCKAGRGQRITHDLVQ